MTLPSSGADRLAVPARGLWTPAAALLAAILLVAAALRLWGLDRLSFWHDEGATYFYADNWPWRIWGKDTMPPLHYLLASIWQRLGEGDWFLRLSSTLTSLGAVAVLWRCGLELGGVLVAALAASFLALAPFDLIYAQEYRMYALLELNAGLAMLGLLRLLRQPGEAARPLRVVQLVHGPADTTLWGWRLYALGSVLTLYTHNMGFLWPLTACVGAALLWHRRGEWRKLAVNWLKVNLIVLLLWAAYWPELFRQLEFVANYLFLDAPSFPYMLQQAAEIAFGLGRSAPALAWILAALSLVLLSLGAWALRRGGIGGFLLLASVLPPVVEWLISLHHPLFATRTLIWIALPSSLLLATGLAFLWRQRGTAPRVAAVAALATLLALRTVFVAEAAAREERSDWRGLLAAAAPQFEAGDVLAVTPFYDTLALSYYRGRDSAAGTPWPVVAVVGLGYKGREQSIDELRSKVGTQGGRVWAIDSVLMRSGAVGLEDVLAEAFDCARALRQAAAVNLSAVLYRVGPGCAD
jgi:hypothetical protein